MAARPGFDKIHKYFRKKTETHMGLTIVVGLHDSKISAIITKVCVMHMHLCYFDKAGF